MRLGAVGALLHIPIKMTAVSHHPVLACQPCLAPHGWTCYGTSHPKKKHVKYIPDGNYEPVSSSNSSNPNPMK